MSHGSLLLQPGSRALEAGTSAFCLLLCVLVTPHDMLASVWPFGRESSCVPQPMALWDTHRMSMPKPIVPWLGIRLLAHFLTWRSGMYGYCLSA